MTNPNPPVPPIADIGERLEPCPFCGVPPKAFPSTDREREVYGDAWTRIKCDNEECDVAPWAQVNCDDTHYEEAAAIWNTRTPSVREGKLIEALTPSEATKAAYIGEFQFSVTDRDEDGDESYRMVKVPWTTVKEIMAAISIRARQAITDLEGEKM